jgi:hypothetical protein
MVCHRLAYTGGDGDFSGLEVGDEQNFDGVHTGFLVNRRLLSPHSHGSTDVSWSQIEPSQGANVRR